MSFWLRRAICNVVDKKPAKMSEKPHRNHGKRHWKWTKGKRSRKQKNNQTQHYRHGNSGMQIASLEDGGSSSNRHESTSQQFEREEAGTFSSSRSETTSMCTDSHKISNYSGRTYNGRKPKHCRTEGLSTVPIRTPSPIINQTSPSTSSCTSASSVSTSSTQTSSAKSERSIPGFYYDPDKKRYFRLVPGHNNFNPLTRESLEKKEAEERRQLMLNENQTYNNRQSDPFKRNTAFCHLQRNTQNGQLSSRQSIRYAQEQAVRSLGLRPVKLDNFPDQYFDGESGDISFLQVDRSQRKVLMVISHDYLSRMWQGTIACDRTKPRSLTITNWRVVNVIGTRNAKITSASWVSMDNSEDLRIIYSLSGGPVSFVQLLKCPVEEGDRNDIMYSYESNHESAWTCAWSSNPLSPAYLSIGSSKKAVVVDTVSAHKWKVFTNHSDVLSQVFSSTTPVLYNGTRRGEILGCDLRSMNHTRSDITLRLGHKVGVCSVRLLTDDNYIVASDMSGQVKLWDLRQCRCVQEFVGQHNRHANLPICMDSMENILYGVGQDSCTRLWSLRDSHLLRTMPCPQPPSNLPPSVAYSQQWHGAAPPGLILGVERSLYWYPLGWSEQFSQLTAGRTRLGSIS